jgi:hypothetical protein
MHKSLIGAIKTSIPEDIALVRVSAEHIQPAAVHVVLDDMAASILVQYTRGPAPGAWIWNHGGGREHAGQERLLRSNVLRTGITIGRFR